MFKGIDNDEMCFHVYITYGVLPLPSETEPKL